jgi:hypothetical protein
MDTTHLVTDLVTRARKIEDAGQLATDLRYAAQLLAQLPIKLDYATSRLAQLEEANTKMRKALALYYDSAVRQGNESYEKYASLSSPVWGEDEDGEEMREREMRTAATLAESFRARQSILKNLYTMTVPEVEK